jgi:hypothetical protein
MRLRVEIDKMVRLYSLENEYGRRNVVINFNGFGLGEGGDFHHKC